MGVLNDPAPLWVLIASGVAIAPTCVDAQGQQLVIRGLYVETSGTAAMVDGKGTSLAFDSLLAGVTHPLRPTMITGTIVAYAVYGN
jgi:hypothetical protein